MRLACATLPALSGALGALGALVALVALGAAAWLGGALFRRMGQPVVIGELLAGIVLGNLGLAGVHGFDAWLAQPALAWLAEAGVLLLLFRTGLESDVARMLAVGRSAFTVAVLGVVAPLVLGALVSLAFFPAHALLTHVFVGATLAATSVGITARVLGDLGRTDSLEGRIILGAAVIDDVLGLIVLAVVSGVITAADHGTAFSAVSVALIVAKAVAFLTAALLLGRAASRFVFHMAARVPGRGLLLVIALGFAALFAWLATRAGLAPIVGAFAAGLVLEEAHDADLLAHETRARSLDELLAPIAQVLVPLFFVIVGTHVGLGALANANVLAFASALTLAAIAGKQLCSLGVRERGADRWAVGFGMIPRGEVGLIFASIGSGLVLAGERVVDDAVYSAVVLTVVATTVLAPWLLAWRWGPRRPPPHRRTTP